MGASHFKSILFVAVTALVTPGCASIRTENQSTKTAGERIITAVGATAVFASETVPMAVLSPVFGVPENQKDLKWYQRGLP
jgi:hypothetical protein